MKEALFLKKNAEKWKQYETELNIKLNPDLLAERFIELTDDLSYSRTFYPQSNTTKYLNGLASRFHQGIYKNKKEKGSRIFSFWKFELPWMFKQYQRQLMIAFLVFMVFSAMGFLSVKYDDSFVRIILGDGYVNMTLENIEKGNPFGIYQMGGSTLMFLEIAINNVFVSFLIFTSGITASVLTVYYLFRNSLMVGAFLSFFYSRHLGTEAILAVNIHGTLELLGMVIETTAGLVLGNAILFPKTFRRTDSFKRGVKDGLKISIGMIPIIIVAAFLESYVTRYYQVMPLALNIFILAGSFIFMIWYFVLYPQHLHRRVKKAKENKLKDENDINFSVWLNKKLLSGN